MDGPDVKTPTKKKWSHKELRSLVKKGRLAKCSQVIDHVAIHPYWLGKPLEGIEEELESRVGRWMPRFGGYLVTYDNIKKDVTAPSAIHNDQPWIHIDIIGTFYAFTPVVGQVLQGVVKKLGNTVAICVIFNYFSATVVPGPDFDIQEWTIESELEFRITSCIIKHKGPQIVAQCMKVLSVPSD